MRGARILPSRLDHAAPLGVLLALAVAVACPAEAQTVLHLDGSVALNYAVTTPTSQYDNGLTTQVSPAVTFQTGSPRLVFRAGYLFSGNINLYGAGASYYSNQLNLALALQPASGSTLVISGSVTQGGTAFQISQGPADAGQPAIRAPGNPDELSASLNQAFSWEASRSVRMSQGFTAGMVAPRFDFDRLNALASVSLGGEHMGLRDAIGGSLSSSVAMLQPPAGIGDPYYSLANSLAASWSRDFSQSWNGQLAAGMAHVAQLAGSYLTALVPTASAVARYLASDVGRSGGSISVAYGPRFDLFTGTLTQAASVTARGVVNFNSPWTRQLSFSAGYLRSWAVNEASVLNAAGLGHAVQGDVGLVWGLSRALLATGRTSLAYQFGQPSGLQPSLTFVFVVGITGRYSTAESMSPVPTVGGRVDGMDGARFPGVPGTKP